MWLQEKEFSIKLGGNYFRNTPVLVSFDGESLFDVVRHEDGYLAINFEVYSEAGTKIASVKRNNISIAAKGVYSLDGEADRLRLIANDSKETLVDIRKRTATTGPTPLDVAVRSYLPNGVLMDLSPDGSNLGGIQMIGNYFQNCRSAISIRSNGGVGIG